LPLSIAISSGENQNILASPAATDLSFQMFKGQEEPGSSSSFDSRNRSEKARRLPVARVLNPPYFIGSTLAPVRRYRYSSSSGIRLLFWASQAPGLQRWRLFFPPIWCQFGANKIR
jgi:hypothetical protein